MPKGIDSARSDRSHVALPPLSRQADSLFLPWFRGGAVSGGVGCGAVSCRAGQGKRVLSKSKGKRAKSREQRAENVGCHIQKDEV